LRATLPPQPIIVNGDRERVQQIFWNLLSNAVKYTPRQGLVEVLVSSDDHEVYVQVRDSGVGIAQEVLPHIFERFRQGDAGPTREHGGLGLGLAIVRHLVEAHGGTVSAESAGVGRGATFIVALPLATRTE
jgi:signal transduction histidine kinase